MEEGLEVISSPSMAEDLEEDLEAISSHSMAEDLEEDLEAISSHSMEEDLVDTHGLLTVAVLAAVFSVRAMGYREG